MAGVSRRSLPAIFHLTTSHIRLLASAVDSLNAFVVHLRRLLRRRGETRERAEDLVQEAYLRMQMYCREGHEVREPEAFLARTALNLAVDARRHDHRSSRVKEARRLELPELAPPLDEILALEERLSSVVRQLDRVNRRTREVFVMHRVQGFSYQEIADRLSISVSSVEKHIASAVALLAIERKSR
jgi:RNA polymerase sigma factor (sigma-70 family)